MSSLLRQARRDLDRAIALVDDALDELSSALIDGRLDELPSLDSLVDMRANQLALASAAARDFERPGFGGFGLLTHPDALQ